MGQKKLRQKIEESCNVIQAVLAFNYRLTPISKAKLDEIRNWLPDASTRKLESWDTALEEDARHAVGLYGCRMDPIRFADFFIQGCRSGKGIPTFSKAEIDTVYFSNFSEGDSIWRELSPHLFLQVHCDWVVIPGKTVTYRYHLPEATLFEDMALAYNSALGIAPRIDANGDDDPDLDVKQRSFYLRTAVLSAFYFVEAFLNGMAFDFFYRNQHSLSEIDTNFLLEEPTGKGKGGFVSFEKKATQYLKVMMKTQHPPLSESNCAALKFMLTDGKDLRDSIVHQSPKVYLASGVPEKTRRMLGLDTESVTATVDAAVKLVKEISAKLGSNAPSLSWLYARTPEGVFPPESFV